MEQTVPRKYERFVIRNPKEITDYKFHPLLQEPWRIYMSRELVAESNVFADLAWRTEMPRPNPVCDVHAHPSPQLHMFVGAAGSFEVEFLLDDEWHLLDRTAMIWIPAGLKHQVRYRRVDGPMVESAILLQAVYE